MPLPSADELEQLEDIERQFAVKAMHHAETYFKLISSIDAQKLRLTKIDDEIYGDFTSSFPEIDVANLKEDDLKLPEQKEKWRPWINKYKGRVHEFDFGTLLRLDHREDYTEQNSIFAVRMQFYAVEIARNRLGLNTSLSQK